MTFLVLLTPTDFDLDAENFNSTGETDMNVDFAELIQLKLVACSANLAGRVAFCEAPTYLERGDYDLVLSIIDLFMPRLEKSFYEPSRMLQDNGNSSFIDIYSGRKCTFQSELNDSVYDLSNSFVTTSLSDSIKNAQMQIDTTSQLDSQSGELKYGQHSSSMTISGQDDENELVKDLVSSYSLGLNLLNSTTSSEEFMKFLLEVKSLADCYIHLNPIQNRTFQSSLKKI
jgi:hypothetical protein